MHIEALYNFCHALPGVTDGFPFDEKTLVFKVMGKMFALTDVDDFDFINLKCEPERALDLRAKHEEITPGYHMNKQHWNSVSVKGSLSDALLEELILHSYELIVQSLPKKEKDRLDELKNEG